MSLHRLHHGFFSMQATGKFVSMNILLQGHEQHQESGLHSHLCLHNPGVDHHLRARCSHCRGPSIERWHRQGASTQARLLLGSVVCRCPVSLV